MPSISSLSTLPSDAGPAGQMSRKKEAPPVMGGQSLL